jgi:hypothetical protein
MVVRPDLKERLFLYIAMAAASFLCGCSGDTPTQGHGASPAQLSTSIDRKLDDLAKMPLQARGLVGQNIAKPITAHGTQAQKDRFADLMKGTSSRMRPGRGG